MQQHHQHPPAQPPPPHPPSAVPSAGGYSYVWQPAPASATANAAPLLRVYDRLTTPASANTTPLLRVYDRLTTQLLRHQQTLSTLDLLRAPVSLLPGSKVLPQPQHQQVLYYWQKHRANANAPHGAPTPPSSSGDVGGFAGGPGGGGAAGTSLRLTQFSANHPPPPSAAPPQPPQAPPPQLRAQQTQPPPHNPHSGTPGAPPVPHSQAHHSHSHGSLSQHSQHHTVLQGGGVGGHGTGGVGTGVAQVGGVPPGPSPAPPGPPHELNTQTLPPGSSQQIQQNSGGSLPVASAHNMMYPTTTQTQQGPQPNTQGQFYPHPGGPNAPPHIHSTGQPRPVTLVQSQHIPNFPVMSPNMMPFYPPTPPSNVYQISPFQTMAPPRQPTPQPGPFHQSIPPQTHPQGPFQTIQYPTQGGKPEPPMAQVFRQMQPMFFPPQSNQHKPSHVPHRERKIIAIVDPTTGKNVLEDINSEKTDSNKSSESSASNTPAPSGTPPNKAEQVDIAAQFAAQVAKKAAEEDTVLPEPIVESVVRTNNKQSENSSNNNIIISDSRDSNDQLKSSSIPNNKVAERVNSDSTDIGVGKTVPEPSAVEVAKPQHPKADLASSSQAAPSSSSPSPAAAAAASSSNNAAPSFQPPSPALSAPPTMLPQMPPQQVNMQQVQQQIPQHLPQQQPPMQGLPQQQPPAAPVQQVAQVPQPVPTQASHQQQQQKPQQPLQSQQQQHQHNPPNAASQQQMPAKQKSPSPQQSVKVQPPNAQSGHQSQPRQSSPQPEAVSTQPKQHMPSPPPQTPQQGGVGNESDAKTDRLSPLVPSVQNEVPSKPEPTLPVKQSSPKPAATATPKEEEKKRTPEPQSVSAPEPVEVAKPQSKVEPPQVPQPAPSVQTPPAVPQQIPQHAPQQPPPQLLSQQAPPPQVLQQNALQPSPQNAAAQQVPPKQKSPSPQQQGSKVPNAQPTPPPQAVHQSSPQPEPVQAQPKQQQQQHLPSPPPQQNDVEAKVDRASPLMGSSPYEIPNKPEPAVPTKQPSPKPATVTPPKEEEAVPEPQPPAQDQCNPVNPDGKRQYDRRFLLELQHNPLSLKKPESLPNLEVVRDGPGRHKPFDPRGPVPHIGGGPDFTPDYVKPTVMGSKQSRPGVGRNHSQQRRPGEAGGGQVSRGGRGGQGKVIMIPLSAGREPKLKTTENAWKPAVLEKDALTDEQAATEEVVKRMRGILNKLTPEKFEKLVGTVRQMPIDTTERLSAVIDLIFEKAVDEQGFSSTYANLCQVLSKMSVRGEGADEGKSEVKFRNLIINKCQKEFEKDNLEEIKPIKMKEIENCTNPEKKQELQAKWDYDETKLRQRSVGNIRFIGELYKLRMLTSPIMMRIIGTLLEKRDEESLECLCKLLTTIGKILEAQCAQQQKAKDDLDKHFRQMHRIVSDRLTNSRVRFLMMDVIDLRENNWVPRREDNKPKTKAEVHEEVKREELEQQMALATTTPSRDRERDRDRDRDRKRSRDNRGNLMSDNDGWNTVASTKSRTPFDSSRLKNTFNRPGAIESKDVINLRGTSFGNWGRGSSGGGLKDHDEVKQQENRFNILGDSMSGGPTSTDNRRAAPISRLAPGGGGSNSGPQRQAFGSKSMPPPSEERENTLSYVKKFVGNDRSKSTSRPESRENSVPRDNNEMFTGPATIDEAVAEKRSIAIIEEFAHNADTQDAKLTIRERFSATTIKYFVQFSLEWVIDRDETKRRRVGQLYHDLILEKLLPFESFLEGVQDTLSMTDDFLIDIPRVCDYFGEIFSPCLNDNAVTLQKLLELSNFANSHSATVFACIIAKAATLMSPNKVADLWDSSGLSWSNIVPASANVDEFLAKQHVEFTVDRSKSTVNTVCSNNSGWDSQKVEAEFLKLFKRASNAEIFDWIEANLGDVAKTSKFIRALVTALVESQVSTSNDGSSIAAPDNFEIKMKDHLTVVQKYVDSSDKLELQCIYALQALSVKHEHPPGLLEKCFNAFYDCEVVSEDAFDEWVKSRDPEEQEGKGVCVASVKSFMRWLKEAETEESENQA